jgi:hypothetical protein
MRSASQAVKKARQYTRYRTGYCLNFVQTMLGAPWSGPSAIWAWNHAKHKHRGDKNPPPGVPVYWSGGRYGHIAVSVGGGRVRSTDWPSRGRVGECSIDQLTRAWRKHYEGWASDIGGQNISGVGHATSHPHGAGKDVYIRKLHYGQKDSDSVKEMQRRLIKLGFHIPAGATGNYFGQTDRAVRAWQKKIGDRPDRAGHSSIGPKQSRRLFKGTGVRLH